MQRLFVSVVFVMMYLTAVAGTAQHRIFPKQTPKDPRATELAGIAAYYMERHDQQITVGAFDAEGKLLANCEIDFLETKTLMSCTMSNGQQYQARWFERHVEFEDLDTRDHFSLHFMGRPSPPSESSFRGVSNEAKAAWSLKGTRSWEEVEQDWGHITPIFGYLLGEIEITLGRISDDESAAHQRFRIKVDEADSFITCPDGEAFCNSDLKCDVGDLGADPTSCCAKISKQADACCEIQTLQTCCANSPCSVICPFGLYCDCFLDGWLWDCQPNCI